MKHKFKTHKIKFIVCQCHTTELDFIGRDFIKQMLSISHKKILCIANILINIKIIFFVTLSTISRENDIINSPGERFLDSRDKPIR